MDSGAEQTRELPVKEITIAPIPRDILAHEARYRKNGAAK